MTLALAVDIGLTLLILAMAGWTIVVRDTFASVIGFVTYGLLLTLVWVRLAAPDVALTEAAMGGGLTGALLISAAARLRGTEATVRTCRRRQPRHNRGRQSRHRSVACVSRDGHTA
jgi:uncharacterized MnhB-related membrane protein